MATSETKQYKSPVDGSRLQLIRRDGQKDVTYRDASTGVEYSEKYAKANFEEVKEVATKVEKTDEEKAAEKEAKAKKAAEAEAKKAEEEAAKAGESGASGPQV